MVENRTSLKLALGTVQFGVHYGISNEIGVPDDKELSCILDIAYNSGISVLDCAPAYGNAEERLGNLSKNRFKIVTKFVNVSDQYSLNSSLLRSLKNLKSDYLYGYISHNSNELLANPRLWDFLTSERDKGRIEKIGYSLYTTQQLEQLLMLDMKPDIIQLPYNILDRNFESYMPELKRWGAEIHTRSVFLQGLFFMDVDNLPAKLIQLKPALNLIQRLCKDMHISITEFALSFVNNNSFVDKILVGVLSADQLRQNISYFNSNKSNIQSFEKIDKIEIVDKTLLNPANWV